MKEKERSWLDLLKGKRNDLWFSLELAQEKEKEPARMREERRGEDESKQRERREEKRSRSRHGIRSQADEGERKTKRNGEPQVQSASQCKPPWKPSVRRGGTNYNSTHTHNRLWLRGWSPGRPGTTVWLASWQVQTGTNTKPRSTSIYSKNTTNQHPTKQIVSKYSLD